MNQQLVASIKYLIRLSEEEEQMLPDFVKRVTLKKNEYFLQEGKVATRVAFIEQGLLRYLTNHNGEEVTLYFSCENEWVGLHESMLTRTPSTKSIIAVEPTVLWTISAEDLQRLYDTFREGDRMGRLIIEDVFIRSAKQITSLYTGTPEQRYHEFFEMFQTIQHRIPQYMIASYIGVKPQSLSRIRKRMAKGIN